MVLSTSVVSRVLRPCVLLELTTGDGTVSTFEASPKQLHSLRFAVAEALQQATAFKSAL